MAEACISGLQKGGIGLLYMAIALKQNGPSSKASLVRNRKGLMIHMSVDKLEGCQVEVA